jgi:crotonobetainyl-CoA:carnitine CoA-transferase CaiB-like acyl-CoA transferase
VATVESPPLSGLTVLSLAEQYPGPYATLVLADLGAQVILVERPTGDPSRANPEFFEALNRNKKSVTLDLASDAGRQAFGMLAASADALIEGFRPGVMTRLGFGYDELSAINDRLVYVSISGFGQTGPYRSRPGHDLSFQALAGLLHDRIGESQPATPWLSIGNLAAGLFAAIGVLAGIAARTRTGRGSYLDLAMLDGLVSLLTVHLAPLLNASDGIGVAPDPGYGLFRTADDGLLALSVYGEDHFWAGLCRAVGLDDDAELSFAARSAREPELRAALAEAIAREPLAEWSERLDAANLPYAPVHDLASVIVDPQVVERGMIAAGDGGRRFVTQPIRVRGVETDSALRSPALGEHTAEVLEAAGCTRDLIEAAVAQQGAGAR